MRSRNIPDGKISCCSHGSCDDSTISNTSQTTSTSSVSISSSADLGEEFRIIQKGSNITTDSARCDSDDGPLKIPCFQMMSTSLLCAMCLILNSALSFFVVEKKRLWTQGHVLPPRCDMAELGFLISFFLSTSGSFMAVTTTDWLWFTPGCFSLFVSSLIYLSEVGDCDEMK